MIDTDLSAALIAFVGEPGRLDEKSSEERVADVLGAEAALDLVPRAKKIIDDMRSADPPLWPASSVAEISERATRWLREHHPELSHDAVRAAANRLSFEWR